MLPKKSQFLSDGFLSVVRQIPVYITFVVLLALPVLILHVRHGGSSPYHILAFLGLVVIGLRLIKPSRPLLGEERLAVLGLLAFVVTIFISLSHTGFSREAVRELDVLLRPLWAILIVGLFVRVRPNQGLLWVGLSLGAIVAGLGAVGEVLVLKESRRADGAVNAIFYGDLALTMGFMAAAGISYFHSKGRLFLIVPAAALLFGLLATILSGARGGWLAIPFLAVILAWRYWKAGYNRRLVVLGVLVMALLAGVSAIPLGAMQRIDVAISEVTGYIENPGVYGRTSIGQRLEMWRAAKDMIQERPWLGGGIGKSYQWFVQEGVKEGRYHRAIARHRLPHSDVLSVMVTRGIVGLMGFALFILIPLVGFVKSSFSQQQYKQDLGFAGMILVVSFVVYGLTGSLLHRGPPLAFYCLYLVFISHLIVQLSRSPITGRGDEN